MVPFWTANHLGWWAVCWTVDAVIVVMAAVIPAACDMGVAEWWVGVCVEVGVGLIRLWLSRVLEG